MKYKWLYWLGGTLLSGIVFFNLGFIEPVVLQNAIVALVLVITLFCFTMFLRNL